ncbi:MAG: prepilin-type N-terminal cleavage/methylation domain-containing protein [Anaerohalosphaeraceae bacterium]
MKKAFTIIELLVAMALLAILVAISGVVFSAAVEAHRTASATTEIMARMRALTEQLDMDMRGIRKDMPVAIWFEYDPATGRRYDQIQFFADGVFQSSKAWAYVNESTTPPEPKTETLEGNTARVYYGHANNVVIDASGKSRTLSRAYDGAVADARSLGTQVILARRAHLMTQLTMPTGYIFPVVSTFTTSFIPWLNGTLYGNDVFEYDNMSLSEWRALLSSPTNASRYILTCFNNDLNGRPGVDLSASDGQSVHMVLTQGVGSFAVQVFNSSLNWEPVAADFPASDPRLGQYYYKTSDMTFLTSFSVSTDDDSAKDWILMTGGFSDVKALKFTFSIYDSKGVFPEGKTFTHIVYLNN